MDITGIMQNTGVSLNDVVDFLPKIQSGFEFLKNKLHLVKDYEKTLNLASDEMIIYSLIPIVSETNKEILVVGFVIKKMEDNSTKIVREAFRIEGLSQVEKWMSNIPKMG